MHARILRLRRYTLDVAEKPAVMGILNVTLDSFYDRGQYYGVDAALARAYEMIDQGAALIDIGGQSSGTGMQVVDEEEEQRRVVPVMQALIRENVGIPISVDTWRYGVARASLEAGADLINDCGGLSDPRMVALAAEHDAGLVIMHLKGRLNAMTETEYPYEDALAEIMEFLRERMERAEHAGVARESIIVDPGLEFGKEPRTDLEILKRFGDLRSLGAPTLLAASRKSFMGKVLGLPMTELLIPSLAAAAAGIAGGASMIRTHDVKETVQFVSMMGAIG